MTCCWLHAFNKIHGVFAEESLCTSSKPIDAKNGVAFSYNTDNI